MNAPRGGIDRRTALGALAALAVSACHRGPLQTIRVATLPRFILAPLYVADELGFFREAGLQLDVQPLTETTQMIPLLAAGQIDVTFAGATPAIFNAVAQGARIRIVAARDAAVPGCTHEAHGSRRSFPDGFTEAAQLKGKRVAVTAPTALTAFLLDVLLESAGLDTRDVSLVSMRLSDSAPALVAGQLDAVIDLDMGFSSPNVVPGPSVASLIPGFQYSYVQFGRALLDGDVRPGAAFLRAYFRGVRAFREGTVPQAMDQLARGSGMDPAGARAACRDRLLETGTVDPASVQRMIDWAARKRFIPSPVDPSLVIDRRFLEASGR
jgi:NitT/TauT family transport system substrate-binding protein